MYSNRVAAMAPRTVLLTEARINPMARKAHTPSVASRNSGIQFRGSGMAYTRCATASSSATTGRQVSHALAMDATRIGSGPKDVSLKRRKILASRSRTGRMPAPHNPLPRMPTVSAMPTI